MARKSSSKLSLIGFAKSEEKQNLRDILGNAMLGMLEEPKATLVSGLPEEVTKEMKL